ncbi:SDR family oxidoreductase [Candidatus Parcubacteria bacterium]|nr:SDR family oxidoreductase [Patescibacteria group bacterium]MCG2693307.1 SDR family oxidoreductase [Candidatus Parcubacteria bacterium]
MPNLQNKVALITGSGRGMGRADALALAKYGAKVVVTDINKENCEKVVKEIKKQKGDAIALKLDVTKKQEVVSAVKQTIKKFGGLDILINNAGIAEFKPFLEMTEDEWDKTLDINLKGQFLCAQAAATQMKKQKGGVIVNIASVAMGQQGIGFPNIAHYCASKGAIAALTEALAVELAHYNIRVNGIAPGMIDTPMIDAVKSDPKGFEAMLGRVPLRRTGKPEEVAELVAFLASDDSSYMTGSVVVIDGGWLAG